MKEKEARRPKDWVMNEDERALNAALLGTAATVLGGTK